MLRLTRSLRLLKTTTCVMAAASSSSSSSSASTRNEAIEQLTSQLFSRGNKILKVVEEMSALPEGLHSFPEVCFVGKPNSGKSSIIGGLCHNPRMGRYGKYAGVTSKLEFFNIGDGLLLVDTPGYGAWEQRTKAAQCLAITNTRRYLTLRKNANLKQVYWVMECPRSIAHRMNFQPRDDEMLEFLLAEQIPFTVVLSKSDHCQGKLSVIQRRVQETFDFFESDRIPIMHVCSRHNKPAQYENLEILSLDIVHHCCMELKDYEVNMKGLHSLSYLPPTAQRMIEVEERYPFAAHVLPISDKLETKAWVEKYQEIALKAAGRALAHGKSELEVSAALKLGSNTKDVYEALTGSGEETEKEESLCLLNDNNDREEENAMHQIESSSTSMSSPATAPVKAFQSRPSLMVVEGDRPERRRVLPLNGNPVSNSGGASLLPSNQARESCASSVVGVPIPRSLVLPSVTTAAAKLDRAGEAYAAMVERQGYSGVINAVRDPFVVTGQDSIQAMDSDDDGNRYHSRRAIMKSRMMAKYVQGVRKERSIQLYAPGYMCPWLEGSGGGQQSQTRRVLGTDCPSSGGRVRGLKETGFGGQSFSAKTMKNRFRATKKTGHWAA